MRPIAILSCDTEPDYLFLLPIVCKSWELQGFDVELYISGHTKQVDIVRAYTNPDAVNIFGDKTPAAIVSNNPKLYVQCIRLYMPAAMDPDRYCILSDADMFIGSSFLYRDFDRINVFGWDLTGYGQVPMCYVGMTAGKWEQVMRYEKYGILNDIETWGTNKDSPDWYKSWGVDQDILTKKLNFLGQQYWHQIPRGIDPRNSGLPLGRWDRHNWQRPQGEVHDVHLMRDPMNDLNTERIIEMASYLYPQEDWTWVYEYRNKFIDAT